MKTTVKELLDQLIIISDKSAQISRIFRTENDELFGILIEEKVGESKNPRFMQDYKTFADVLIQEMAKFCLEEKFPGFSRHIYGEETNQFQNKLGEIATIQVGKDIEQTFQSIAQILADNERIARSIVEVIYTCDTRTTTESDLNTLAEHVIDLEQTAIWIDPIDSTTEYINGYWKEYIESIPSKGLQCVTCLFGVFDIQSGLPFMGVLHQPFYKKHDNKTFSGRCIWGLNIDNVCCNNLSLPNGHSSKSPETILIGGQESEVMKQRLNSVSRTMYVAGAGYKLLTVALGHASLLVISSKSTFFWDTCAGHAILRSLGGGIIAFADLIHLNDQLTNLHQLQIKYKQKHDDRASNYCNSKGLVAYANTESFTRIVNLLNYKTDQI